MPRRHNPDKIPGWRELLDASGYGWIVELGRGLLAVGMLALILGSGWLAWHYATTGIQQAMQQPSLKPTAPSSERDGR